MRFFYVLIFIITVAAVGLSQSEYEESPQVQGQQLLLKPQKRPRLPRTITTKSQNGSVNTLHQIVPRLPDFMKTPVSSTEILSKNITIGTTKSSCQKCPPELYAAEWYIVVSEDTGDTVEKDFDSPIPYGYLITEVQVDIMCSFDCNKLSMKTAVNVQLGAMVVTKLYPFPVRLDSCVCISCHQKVSIPADPLTTDFWAGFNYTGTNTIQFIFIRNSVGISYFTINFEILNINPNISFYEPQLSPSTDGGSLTIMGNNFFQNFEYRCEFFKGFELIYHVTAIPSDDPSHSMTCQLPKSLPININASQKVPVSLWIYPVTEPYGRVEFGESIGPFEYQFYSQPMIKSIVPDSGTYEGGTTITISGTGFFESDDLTCRFGFMLVPATYLSPNVISCVTPSLESKTPSIVLFEVSQNGFSWTNSSLAFAFVNPPPGPPEPLSQAQINMYMLIGGSVVLLVITLSVVFFAYLKNKLPSNKIGYAQIRESFDSEMIIPRSDITIKEIIGRGSFGSVYRALWRHTEVAVKKIDLDPNHKVVTELYEEAKLMIALRHPNVVTFMGVTLPPEVCIITEYVSRGSLYSILHNEKIQFEWEHVRKFALDTCMGMAYLHAAKIIHRDLKTHNLLVDKGWNIKVCDFGMSRSIEERNKTMTACGTPCWTAPEVLRNQRYSFKADVYSFGICLWEMISREAPYGNMPPYQVVISVATKGMRPTIPVGTLPEFERLISVSWAEDDETRPDFGTLVETLESAVTPIATSPFPIVLSSSTSPTSSASNSTNFINSNRSSSSASFTFAPAASRSPSSPSSPSVDENKKGSKRGRKDEMEGSDNNKKKGRSSGRTSGKSGSSTTQTTTTTTRDSTTTSSSSQSIGDTDTTRYQRGKTKGGTKGRTTKSTEMMTEVIVEKEEPSPQRSGGRTTAKQVKSAGKKIIRREDDSLLEVSDSDDVDYEGYIGAYNIQ